MFRAVARRLLGIPLPSALHLRRCASCGQSTAGWSASVISARMASCGSALLGDRGHGGGTVYQTVHDEVAVQLERAGQEAGFGSELETEGLLPGSDDRPADILLMDAARLYAIDVRVAHVQMHGTVDSPPGIEIAKEEEAKRQRYTVRCRAEGITFIPFVLDEFGHLGDCATLLLDALADRYAERARGDYREGRDAGQRRAAFLMRWRTRITYAAHSAVIRCIQERARRSLVQSMRIRGP